MMTNAGNYVLGSKQIKNKEKQFFTQRHQNGWKYSHKKIDKIQQDVTEEQWKQKRYKKRDTNITSNQHELNFSKNEQCNSNIINRNR